MDYKQKILSLLDRQYKKIGDIESLDKYKEIINILELSLEDLQYITRLSNFDVSFVINSNLKDLLNVLKKVSQLRKESLDENEVNNLLESTKTLLVEEERSRREPLNELNSVSNAVNNLTPENVKILIEFIQKGYKKQEISELEAVNLIIQLSKIIVNNIEIEKTDVNSPEKNDFSTTIEIIVNAEPLEGLEELFAEYGYQFDLMNKNEQARIKKYATKDNIRYVLKLLSNNNISPTEFLAKAKQITELIIYFDKEGLDNIDTFIKNNHCSLNYLLSLTCIFFSRKKEFVFKNKNSKPREIDIITPQKDYRPVGGYENFLYCVELIRKSKGYDSTYKLTDDDLKSRADGKGMNVFLTTAKDIIENNILILKRYKLIDGDKLPNAITSLIGSNTEYLLDRAIEAGIYEYITKNMSFLGLETASPFKWYKIKRALDTNQEIYYLGINNGLKRELRNDTESFNGISILENESSRIIVQKPMTMSDLIRGSRQIPEKFRVNSYGFSLGPDSYARQEFNRFYRYRVYSPIDIYKICNINNETGFKIEEVFNQDYNNPQDLLNNVAENETIKTIDSLVLSSITGESYSVKRDDLTYVFYQPANGGWPEETIIISRQKVLRLCSLLNRKGLWINQSMSNIEKTSLLLSVLLKDSVVSVNQFKVLRNIVNNIVIKSKENIGGMHR